MHPLHHSSCDMIARARGTRQEEEEEEDQEKVRRTTAGAALCNAATAGRRRLHENNWKWKQIKNKRFAPPTPAATTPEPTTHATRLSSCQDEPEASRREMEYVHW
jgi:hypothetical protein